MGCVNMEHEDYIRLVRAESGFDFVFVLPYEYNEMVSENIISKNATVLSNSEWFCMLDYLGVKGD